MPTLDRASSAGELVDYAVKPNFRELGRRFGAQTPAVAAAIGSRAAPRDVAAAVLTVRTGPVDGRWTPRIRSARTT